MVEINYEEIRKTQNERVENTITPAVNELLKETSLFGENAYVVMGKAKTKAQTEEFGYSGWLWLRETEAPIYGTKIEKNFLERLLKKDGKPRQKVRGFLKVTHGFDFMVPNKINQTCNIELSTKDMLGKDVVAKMSGETTAKKEPSREEIKSNLAASLSALTK